MYEQSIDGCLKAVIGDAGLDEATFDQCLQRARTGVDRIRAAHRDGSLPVFQMAEERDDIPMIEDRAAYHRERADTVLVMGTGGSSLGGQAFYALADSGFGPSGDSPRVVFLDNIDPHTFDHVFRSLDMSRTDFLLISKSGGTAETMTQALICVEELSRSVDESQIGDHFTVITEPKASALSRLAQKWGMVQLPHDPEIGGRFSALSLVGMLPAAIAGLDPALAREGAEPVIASLLIDYKADPVVGAAVQCGLSEACGIKASVMMPYCDRLGMFGFWYRQLWAESLGKQGEGTVPVRALGTVDQHSQLQLYLDGPRDKSFTMIQTPVARTGRLVRTAIADGEPSLSYLDGRSMGDLLDSMQRVTTDTLIKNGCPTRLIKLEQVDEAAIGALMMHYMAETVIAADMLGMNAFNQPAVEQGKILARDYMSQIAPRG